MTDVQARRRLKQSQGPPQTTHTRNVRDGEGNGDKNKAEKRNTIYGRVWQEEKSIILLFHLRFWSFATSHSNQLIVKKVKDLLFT